ncbi:hypothetical protein MKX03_034247 [Papaver bracteatum]|nr:hypothetical protein MKX03_034247 [Papaver bracteatum]
MGSLMGGWDSPVRDLKSVTNQRNNSCTQEEIEAYWKSKEPSLEKENYIQRVIDQENTSEKGNILDVDETAIDKLIKTNSWWTRSNWAFLNESPVIATLNESPVIATLNESPVIATTDHEGRAM